MRAKPVETKAFVWDFDDTLFKTEAKVHVYDSNTGKYIKSLDAEEFNRFKKLPFHFLDFNDFVNPNLILKAEPYKEYVSLKKIDELITAGKIIADIYILTGRTPHVQKAIFDLLKKMKIKNIEGNKIICMGDGRGEINIPKEKTKILKELKKDYDKIFFFDDNEENITLAKKIGISAYLIEEYIKKIDFKNERMSILWI